MPNGPKCDDQGLIQGDGLRLTMCVRIFETNVTFIMVYALVTMIINSNNINLNVGLSQWAF